MSASRLDLVLRDATTARSEQVEVSQLIIAGWTGRDRTALMKHIRELEDLGVKAPSTTPVFYRVSAARLTTAPAIEVPGEASSGEVEFVLLQTGGRLWVGLGSDHTDRKAETYDVTVSKQMCEKPIAAEFWAFDDIAAHWDRLMLRSFIIEGGQRIAYQEGSVASMLAPHDLLSRFHASSGLAEGTMMFCGTLAAHGGIRSAPRFEFEIEDPVLQRSIHQGYDIVCLPVAS